MWKYISGVPKVVEEKKKEKTRKLPVIQKSTRRTGPGSFRRNGKLAGRGYSMIAILDKGMICEWCIENKQTLVAQNVLNVTRFIDGCTTYKAES